MAQMEKSPILRLICWILLKLEELLVHLFLIRTFQNKLKKHLRIEKLLFLIPLLCPPCSSLKVELPTIRICSLIYSIHGKLQLPVLR